MRKSTEERGERGDWREGGREGGPPPPPRRAGGRGRATCACVGSYARAADDGGSAVVAAAGGLAHTSEKVYWHSRVAPSKSGRLVNYDLNINDINITKNVPHNGAD